MPAMLETSQSLQGEGAPRTKVGTRTTAAVKDAATRVAI
jgi:hypothetical protein